LEETLEIARRLGVKHPTDPVTGYPVVMTTDFFLKLRLGGETVYHARTVKYRKDLDDPRVCEKFKIESRYYRRRDIDWDYVTEDKVTPGLAENAALIHPFYFLSDLYPLTERDIRKITFYLTDRVRKEKLPLIDIVNDCDQKFGLEAGKSFSVACHLIVRSVWRINLRKPIRVNEILELL
jgi:hypothetical protein